MTSASHSECKGISGFGLVSLMLVILVLSIAAITVMAWIAPSLATRQRLDTESRGKALRVGIDRYIADNGSSPGSFDNLLNPGTACGINTAVNPPVRSGWCGPYIEPLIANAVNDYGQDYKKDGWGVEFWYNSTGNALKSCGPDRSCGNSDDLSFL
jgi:type II secretory pathway pseudopilin PulG